MVLVDRRKRIAAANHLDPRLLPFSQQFTSPAIGCRTISCGLAGGTGPHGKHGGQEDLDEPDL